MDEILLTQNAVCSAFLKSSFVFLGHVRDFSRRLFNPKPSLNRNICLGSLHCNESVCVGCGSASLPSARFHISPLFHASYRLGGVLESQVEVFSQPPLWI